MMVIAGMVHLSLVVVMVVMAGEGRNAEGKNGSDEGQKLFHRTGFYCAFVRRRLVRLP